MIRTYLGAGSTSWNPAIFEPAVNYLLKVSVQSSKVFIHMEIGIKKCLSCIYLL